MLLDNLIGQGLVKVQAIKLEQQGFTNIARGDAGRV